MSRRIKQRWVLVILLAVAQAACLAVAMIWFTGLVERGLRRIVRERLLVASRQYAVQAVDRFAEGDLEGTGPDAVLARLQEIVESASLPNEGFLCVLDNADGRIVCHPDLARNPSLAELDMGSMTLEGTGRPVLLAGETGPAAGWLTMDDGTHIVAVVNLADHGLSLLAHQREEPVRAVVDRFGTRIRTIGLGVAVAFLPLVGFVSMFITRRYENRLAIRNEDLNALVEKRSAALLHSRGAVILGLAKLAELRDDQTGRHLERIGAYVRLLGDEMIGSHPEVDRVFVDTIVDTSALHDIGKVGIPDQVLLKPGKLTDEQRDVIQKHPLTGGDTLLAIRRQWGDDQFLVTACEIAFAHHERFDGTGYPFGLAGDTIPLSARIVALADVYDALTTKRSYKEPFSHEEAKRIILEGSGTHFDPAVVAAFEAADAGFRAVAERMGPGA
ncbi:MAG: HD-GYP domain-containing protein [Planctomycetota bacterium]